MNQNRKLYIFFCQNEKCAPVYFLVDISNLRKKKEFIVCAENTKVLPQNLIYEFLGSNFFFFISLNKEDSRRVCFHFPLSELTLSHPHGTGITVYIPRFFLINLM